MLPFRGPPPPARGFPMPVPGAAPPAMTTAGIPPRGILPPPGALVPPPRGAALPFGAPTLGRPPPVGMMPPPGLALGPPPAYMGGIPPPGAMNPMLGLPDTGPLNVFVGKLPPDLHDNYIRHLLEKCGHVLTWKRTTDPVTGKPKGFGYCTFANPTDVLRALRLLNGFSLDSKQILLKVDSKTQTRLDAYASAMSDAMRQADKQRDREVELALKTLFEDRNGLMGGHQNDVASWGDLLERRNNEAAKADAPTAVDESAATSTDGVDQNNPENQADGAPRPGEKVRGNMILSEIEKFRLAQEQREQEMEQKRREAVRERLRREQEEEQRRKAKEEAARAASEAAMMEKEDPAKQQATKEAKEKGDRQASSGSKDQERDRHKTRTREREHDRGRDRDRSRERRRRDRSRSRSRERSSRHRRHRRSRSRTPSRSRSRSRRDRKRRRRHDSSDRSDTEKRSRSKRRRDSEDTPASRKSSEVDAAPAVRAPRPVMPKVVLGLKMQSAIGKKEKPAPAVNVSVFAVEEEAEAKPVREIIPIDYSEEERLATASMQQRAAATTARINGRSDDLKTLVDQIPTDKDALFAFPINWTAVEKFNIVTDKMHSWVTKKIHEYLGEEEPTMIEFIIKKLRQRAAPQSILDELKLVLDDEAEMFVQLLWRRLAFEALRSASS